MPKEAVTVPFPEVFKARLDVALGSLIQRRATLPTARGLKLDVLKGSFQPRPFDDLGRFVPKNFTFPCVPTDIHLSYRTNSSGKYAVPRTKQAGDSERLILFLISETTQIIQIFQFYDPPKIRTLQYWKCCHGLKQ